MCKASILLLPDLLACGFHVSSRSDIPETDPGSFWQNSLFGLRFLRRNSLLLWLACVVCLMNFLTVCR
jgi:hypothetical protein